MAILRGMSPTSEIEGLLYEVLTHYRDSEIRGGGARRRHADLVRVHADGWKLVADALTRGLTVVADAIRHCHR